MSRSRVPTLSAKSADKGGAPGRVRLSADGPYLPVVMPEHVHLLLSEPERGTLAMCCIFQLPWLPKFCRPPDFSGTRLVHAIHPETGDRIRVPAVPTARENRFFDNVSYGRSTPLGAGLRQKRGSPRHYVPYVLYVFTYRKSRRFLPLSPTG